MVKIPLWNGLVAEHISEISAASRSQDHPTSFNETSFFKARVRESKRKEKNRELTNGDIDSRVSYRGAHRPTELNEFIQTA